MYWAFEGDLIEISLTIRYNVATFEASSHVEVMQSSQINTTKNTRDIYMFWQAIYMLYQGCSSVIYTNCSFIQNKKKKTRKHKQ